MTEFFHKFNHVVLNILTLPLPTAAAVKAHAVAGGAIMMLTCDYGFAAAGRVLIGLNGIKLGVPIPYLPDLILRQIAGDEARFGHAVSSGSLSNPRMRGKRDSFMTYFLSRKSRLKPLIWLLISLNSLLELLRRLKPTVLS